MKKTLKSLMLAAAAATAFAGCSKENLPDNTPQSGALAAYGFTAEIAASRTTLDDGATRLRWTAGDRLGLYTDAADLNVASSDYAEGTAANFTAELAARATKVYAYYPYAESQGQYTYRNAPLPIPVTQTQTEAGVLNGRMVGMYADATLAEGGNTVLTFTPIAALLAFDLHDTADGGEAVQRIAFTPADGEKLNGDYLYDLTTGTTKSDASGTSASVTLATPYAVPAAVADGKSGLIYLAVTPKRYAGGTFTVTTDRHAYAFETAKTIDVSNVYDILTVPMDLAKGNVSTANGKGRERPKTPTRSQRPTTCCAWPHAATTNMKTPTTPTSTTARPATSTSRAPPSRRSAAANRRRSEVPTTATAARSPTSR